MMSPIVEQLPKQYADKVDFYKVDIGQEVKLAAIFGLPVVKVGVNFDMATHNITDWKVEE